MSDKNTGTKRITMEVIIPIPPLYYAARSNPERYKGLITAFVKTLDPNYTPTRIKGSYVHCEKFFREERVNDSDAELES